MVVMWLVDSNQYAATAAMTVRMTHEIEPLVFAGGFGVAVFWDSTLVVAIVSPCSSRALVGQLRRLHHRVLFLRAILSVARIGPLTSGHPILRQTVFQHAGC